RERHELKSAPFRDGEYWFNWSIYIPEDYPVIYPVKVALGQFHQEGSHPVWMFQNGKGGYIVDNQVYGSTLQREQILSDAQMRGKWSDILLHVNFSAKKDGFFKVYVNGESAPSYSWEGKTKKPGYQVYYKVGIYRSFISRGEGEAATQVVYYDDIARGSSCEEVARYFDCAAIAAQSANQ
ncbi:MAG: heparin lyase I family protein, partial [Pseudomonadales bacterium]